MDDKGLRPVRVRKRDGRKLVLVTWRAIGRPTGRYGDARLPAEASGLFLEREVRRIVSSAAVFEMAVRAVDRVRLVEAARAPAVEPHPL